MPSSTNTRHTPTVTDVDRITGIVDPVMRNLHITLCYHELALAMTARTGLSANWCTFATWASKQAGQTIRREDFTRALEDSLLTAQATADTAASLQALGSNHSRAEIQETLVEVLNPLAAFDRASAAVGRGNKKVYEEIGREFARFCAACLNDTVFNPDHLQQFLAGLRAGDPPDGQDYLRKAFTSYYHALFEPDAKTRAELMFFANLQIGYHEQTRLQPEIAEALNAAFVDRRQIRLRIIKALFPYNGIFIRTRLFLLWLFDRPSALDALIGSLQDEAQRRAHAVITHCIMTIGMPDGVRLRLGEDLPANFPSDLQHLTLPDLCVLLESIDRTKDSPRGSAAGDWSLLPDRLNFIADLFRCYHQRAHLFDPPFTAEQITALKLGRLPAGQL